MHMIYLCYDLIRMQAIHYQVPLLLRIEDAPNEKLLHARIPAPPFIVENNRRKKNIFSKY